MRVRFALLKEISIAEVVIKKHPTDNRKRMMSMAAQVPEPAGDRA